ncbi:MAG: glycosyltransferase [Pararhodobacter sp.]|nr:glycosyltransferase [Pararhodobacter sp.]
MMPTLLMISPAPIVETPAGEVVLDVAFVEGMRLHCQLWPGKVYCLMRRGTASIPGGMRFSPRQLDFNLIVQDPGDAVPDLLLQEASLVYCAADDMQYLDMPARLKGRLGRLVYTVEQPLSGRLGAIRHDSGRNPLSRLRGMQWTMGKERALRQALRQADGVHCNGPLASDVYGRLNPRTLAYMDNRMRMPMLARGPDQTARAQRLRAGAPLTLSYFGAFEPEAGVSDLLAVAHLLHTAGLPFRMELFGTGSLAPRLQDGVAALGLKKHVHLSAPPGFDAALVPHLRRNADVFLSPRRMADPVSSYIEAMGCGLPVLGYDNAQWRRLQAEAGAGWVVSAHASALARQILRLDRDRELIIRASTWALDHARANTFETVFARRMSHLRQIAGLD